LQSLRTRVAEQYQQIKARPCQAVLAEPPEQIGLVHIVSKRQVDRRRHCLPIELRPRECNLTKQLIVQAFATVDSHIRFDSKADSKVPNYFRSMRFALFTADAVVRASRSSS
jgi:hypothetical protein